MSDDEMQIRVTDDVLAELEAIAADCFLTRDQVASMLVAYALRKLASTAAALKE